MLRIALVNSQNIDTSRFLTYFEHEGKAIPMFRVDENAIQSYAKKNILDVQKTLDEFHGNYLRKEPMTPF
jgi:hypothetical protein